MRSWYHANRERVREAQRRYREKNRDKLRAAAREYHRIRRQNNGVIPRPFGTWTLERQLDAELRFSYGIGVEEYKTLVAKQDGKCAICQRRPPFGNKKRLCVDHDHVTGAIRGLLCPNCNSFLGRVRDDLSHAVAYLDGQNRRVPDLRSEQPSQNQRD